MNRATLLAALLASSLAACRSQDGSPPDTMSGRPALLPARRLVCRIREDAAGGAKAPGVDEVLLDRSTSMTATAGDTIRVELKTNAGTGYQWIFVGCDDRPTSGGTAGTPQVAVPGFDWKKGQVPATAADRPGGPVLHVFEFTAGSPGSSTLAFALVRPWEKDTPPADRRQLTVQVKPAGN